MPSTVSLEKIAKAYNSPTWWYDIRGFFILTFAYRATLWQQVRFFGGNMGELHLESAIGTGTLFAIIMRWRALTGKPKVTITGFDYAEPMLEGARRRFAKYPNITLMQADVGALGLPDQQFDTINVANALHCFPNLPLALSELHRVLKPGGTLAMNVLIHPKGNSFLDRIAKRLDHWGQEKGILVTPYTLEEIRSAIAAAGFTVTYDHYHGNVLDVMATRS